eukprot:973421_1
MAQNNPCVYVYGERQPCSFTEDISVRAIYPGSNNTFFVDDDDQIWFTGRNVHGQSAVGNNQEAIVRDKKIKITFFQNKGICIKAICPCDSSTFWITTDNKLYGNGYNGRYLLGIGDNKDRHSPHLIASLQNIIKVQSDCVVSFALNSSGIVYVAGHPDFVGEYGQWFHNWAPLPTFHGQRIIDMTLGSSMGLFLESNGKVWVFGNNMRGALGNGRKVHGRARRPHQIEFFRANNIVIKQIASGSCHNMALDTNGKAYAWGWNAHGQCGDITTNDCVLTPKHIQMNLKVIQIKCGSCNSCIKTEDGKWYTFGSNGHHKQPFCIDDEFKQKYGKIIKNIYCEANRIWVVAENGEMKEHDILTDLTLNEPQEEHFEFKERAQDLEMDQMMKDWEDKLNRKEEEITK